MHGDEQAWRDWPDMENFAVKLKVWAPTAQSVSLQIFDHEFDTDAFRHNTDARITTACG